jgi:hypothetical protein
VYVEVISGTITKLSLEHATDITERPLRVSFMGGVQVQIMIKDIGSLP